MKRQFILILPWLLVGLLSLYVGFSKLSTSNLPTPLTGWNPVSATPASPQPTQATGWNPVTVTRVVDGDTIEIEGGQRVRYIGIDTPETVKPGTPVQCFGKHAADNNKELVLGKKVRLEKDVSEVDKYGRLLRYVWVEEIFVNDYLVRNGYAQASTYPPDVKYQSQFAAAQKEAQENQIGLWSPNACATIPSASVQTTLDPRELCSIKGNINSEGEKIYHMPGQRYYDKTQVDEAAGEHWFCTEKEAELSGWRKSKV